MCVRFDRAGAKVEPFEKLFWFIYVRSFSADDVLGPVNVDINYPTSRRTTNLKMKVLSSSGVMGDFRSCHNTTTTPRFVLDSRVSQ